MHKVYYLDKEESSKMYTHTQASMHTQTLWSVVTVF